MIGLFFDKTILLYLYPFTYQNSEFLQLFKLKKYRQMDKNSINNIFCQPGRRKGWPCGPIWCT